MNKKFFVSLAIILFTIFSFTICFANDGHMLGNGVQNATNDVRNFVGGVENTVENAALDVSNSSKNITRDAEDEMKVNDNNDGKYTAKRTSTDNTVMGMNSTTWTWLIIGIAAIAIIAVIWYYSMQLTNNNHNNDD